MVSELKPCPFCNQSTVDYFNDDGYISVQCENCGAIGEWGNENEEASGYWNTRPIEDAIRAELASAKQRLNEAEEALNNLDYLPEVKDYFAKWGER
jgi:Lar family restriction alleviation protein